MPHSPAAFRPREAQVSGTRRRKPQGGRLRMAADIPKTYVSGFPSTAASAREALAHPFTTPLTVSKQSVA